DRIASHYSKLSGRLRDAADYVLANPVDVATRSLRSVAEESRLAPATFTRLAQALGFPGYEDLREKARRAVGKRYSGFSEKAQALHEGLASGSEPPFLTRQCSAVIENLTATAQDLDPERIEAFVDDLEEARTVYAVGGLSSSGLIHHVVYLAGFFSDRWRMIGQSGASALAGAGPGDMLIILTLRPFASGSIRLAQSAKSLGLEVAVITDTHACPALPHASHHFVVPTESPQFFSSNAAIVTFFETIMGMLVARMGVSAQERIAAVTNLNHDLEVYWPGS
ncbi:MAG: MurR/RpiR family transcriptional regulator, partial [Pseudomonadota bacterium]